MWGNLMDEGHLEVLVYTYFESNETKLKDVGWESVDCSVVSNVKNIQCVLLNTIMHLLFP